MSITTKSLGGNAFQAISLLHLLQPYSYFHFSRPQHRNFSTVNVASITAASRLTSAAPAAPSASVSVSASASFSSSSAYLSSSCCPAAPSSSCMSSSSSSLVGSSRSLFFLPSRAVSRKTSKTASRARMTPRGKVTILVRLLQDEKSLGYKGDLVRVRRGYMRNFLQPRGVAAYHVVDRLAKYRTEKTETQQQQTEQNINNKEETAALQQLHIVNSRRFVDFMRTEISKKRGIQFKRNSLTGFAVPVKLNDATPSPSASASASPSASLVQLKPACYPLWRFDIRDRLVDEYGLEHLQLNQIHFPPQPLPVSINSVPGISSSSSSSVPFDLSHHETVSDCVNHYGEHEIFLSFGSQFESIPLKIEIVKQKDPEKKSQKQKLKELKAKEAQGKEEGEEQEQPDKTATKKSRKAK